MKRPARQLFPILSVLCAAAPALAAGTPLPLDPGPPFTLYTTNTNDGYGQGRGMVFVADEAISVNGAALWTAEAAGLNATIDLYSVIATSGNVLAGATLLRSVNAVLSGPLGFHGAKFPSLTLVPGQAYLVRVSYAEDADENWFNDFDPVVFGDLPVDIGPVTLIDGEHAGDTSNFVSPLMALQLADINVFLDPAAFQQAVQGAGKVTKASWDFKPHDLPVGGVVGLDDPLDILTHGLNGAEDPWTDAAGGNLWPADVDNVQFVSNTTPQGPLTPHGLDGLAFATVGFGGLDNNALVANFGVDSFDIISGPPAGDNHTAIALELIDFFNGGVVHVTVYDKDGLELAKILVQVPPIPGKAFVGILRKDRETIGRIDIWDPNGGFEGISQIALYRNSTCPWDCGNNDGNVGIVDFLALLGQWGLVGTPCDFDGGGVGITDFLKLLGNWGPCPGNQGNCPDPEVCGSYVPGCDPGNPDCICTTTSTGVGFCLPGSTSCAHPICVAGTCPPGFTCIVGTCCGVDICVPDNLRCPGAPAAALPPGTLTVSGVTPGLAPQFPPAAGTPSGTPTGK